MRERVISLVKSFEEELVELNQYIYDNPELGYEEYKSSKAHIDILKKHNFKVEENYIKIKTAFRGEYDSKKPGATIGYIAEYDALPGIGHGCGHNILGTTSTGAGIALSKLLDEIGGKVVVIGTPAEETSGAKVEMATKGAFNDLDVALIVHPSTKFMKSGTSLALDALEFTFKGRAAHAAATPERGVNALDACIATFNSVNALREHIASSARIHGIIKEGGKAANIVPDRAVAQFYVRATTKTYLEELTEKVKNCARAAALATGTKLEIKNFEASYDNLVTNENLQDIFIKNLNLVGVDKIEEPEELFGSTDVGNVSQVCPAIHPCFAICEEGIDIPSHSVEFAQATITEVARENMLKTIIALTLTGMDIIINKELLKNIKDEFEASIKNA